MLQPRDDKPTIDSPPSVKPVPTPKSGKSATKSGKSGKPKAVKPATLKAEAVISAGKPLGRGESVVRGESKRRRKASDSPSNGTGNAIEKIWQEIRALRVGKVGWILGVTALGSLLVAFIGIMLFFYAEVKQDIREVNARMDRFDERLDSVDVRLTRVEEGVDHNRELILQNRELILHVQRQVDQILQILIQQER